MRSLRLFIQYGVAIILFVTPLIAEENTYRVKKTNIVDVGTKTYLKQKRAAHTLSRKVDNSHWEPVVG